MTDFISRELTKIIAAEAQEALKAIAEKHGLIVKGEGGKFTESSATLKFSFSTVSENGTAETPEYSALMRYGAQIGATAEDFSEARLIENGRKVRIVGFKPRAPKRPFIIEDVNDGKKFITTVGHVKRFWTDIKFI